MAIALAPSRSTRTLPYELVEYIFIVALTSSSSSSNTNTKSSSSSSKQFATTLCLVSSSAKALALPLLLRTITFQGRRRVNHPSYFPYRLSSKTNYRLGAGYNLHHAALVRRLCTLGHHTPSYGTYLPSIISACPNLTDLALYLSEFPHTIATTISSAPDVECGASSANRTFRLLLEVPAARGEGAAHIAHELMVYHPSWKFSSPAAAEQMMRATPIFAMVSHLYLDTRRMDVRTLDTIFHLFRGLTHFAVPIKALAAMLFGNGNEDGNADSSMEEAFLKLPKQMRMMVLTVEPNAKLDPRYRARMMSIRSRDDRVLLYFHHSTALDEWKYAVDGNLPVWNFAYAHTLQWQNRG